jgi:RHS repeat-associated protein
VFVRSAVFATSTLLLIGTTASVRELLDGTPLHQPSLICPDPNDPQYYSVSVTPDAGSASWQENTTNHKAVFTIQNTGLCVDQYTFTPYSSGSVTVVSQSKSSSGLNAHVSTVDTVTYNVGSAGSGTVTLQASSGMAGDQGYYNVTITLTPYRVAVTPDGATTPNRLTNTAYVDTFTVENTGANTDTFALTCTSSSNVTCGALSPAGPLALTSNALQKVAANYTTGSPGTGLLKLRAASSHSNDSGSYNVPVILQGAALRAELAERQQFTLTRISHRFFVKNLQPQSKTYNLSAVCSGTASTCQVSPASLSLAFGESQVATVTDTAATAGTGTVMLRAVDATVSNLRDSSSVALTSVTAPAPVVSLVSTNPGTVVERDRCLAIAAGQNAAFECGDLRVVHALPAIRTVNKARLPTLIYNSAYAQSYPVFTAQVTVNTVPDSVEAILKVGGVEQTRARWAGSNWVAGGTRQIALAYSPPDTAATSVRDYTIDIATIYLPSGYYLTSTAGKFILVNRAKSIFGGGWWLAGLERVYILADSNRLWVSGDGSARLYTSAGSNVWVAPNLDRPDTLWRNSSRYSRRLSGGVFVGFNAAGLHDSTVNRLGHRTGFGYDTVAGITRLRTITLPSQGGSQTYTFNYDANNKLANVAAPGSRTASFVISAERMDTIRDADNRATAFSYSGSSKRITGRTDRRGTLTRFAYDTAAKLFRVIIPALASDSIRAGFKSRELIGLATATPKTATDTGNVYTSLFGARNFAMGGGYIAQETKFWLDRYGAPRQVVNPLGHLTIVKREEGQWVALATEQQAPNGFIQRAQYDGRGNISASIAIQPFGSGGRAPNPNVTTRYHWDGKWDFVDSVITPTGVTSSMSYDTLNGNRLWQQLGPDAARRVRFRYQNSCGLLSSDSLPNTPVDSVTYDAMCNLAVTLTPKRFDTQFLKDAIGRDTMMEVRLDTLTPTPIYRTTVTRYDVLDRDTLQISAGPAMNGAAAETLYIRKRYNNAGQLDSLWRWSRPAVTSVGTLTTRWEYDTAGRVIVEIAPDQRRDSMFYDAAGNDTLSLTRRRDSLRMSYDALNRLSRRIVPGYSYPTRSSEIVNDKTGLMGSHLPHSYDPYVIAADTQTYSYDSLGNIRTARNSDARVVRTYYPIGLLATDSLVTRTVQGWDSTKHGYMVTHVYDLDGRQTRLNVPSQLGSLGQTGVTYAYDPQLGLLTSVSDLMDSVYTFTYTLRNERATLRFPSSPYLERFGYDADGRLAADTILNQRGAPPDTVRSNRFWYDAANRLLKRVDRPGMYDTLNLSYSGLGHLVASHLSQHASLMQSCAFTQHTVNEAFFYDALGNRDSAQTDESFDTGSACGNSSEPRGSSYDSTSGRLVQDDIGGGVTTFSYDSAGNQTFSQDLVGPKIERASYYGADGRVRATDSRTSYGALVTWTRAFEEYRYDALGRRIWVRSRKSCYTGTATHPFSSECNTSLLRRTVWDGDQILAEIQMPGGDSTGDSQYWENDTAAVFRPWFHDNDDADPSRYFGRVVYTHAGAIDQPLSITRYQYVHALDDNWARLAQPLVIPRAGIMPFWNAQGDAPLGAFHDGNLRFCLTPTTNCEGVAWPFKWAAYNRQRGPVSDNWQGSMLEGGRDKSGLDFKRNRLYEPQTGRFTQEDPIGLSGGLNLYGFASGDPVNFSDPFGLCPSCLGLVDPALIFSHTAVVGVGVGRDVHIGYLDGSREIRSGGTRSWRNNNPGNMRNSTFSQGQGSIGTAGGFAIFRTSDAGHNALSNLLETDTYQSLTVGGAIARFAPSSENDTPAYQRAVTRATGTSPDTPMNGLNGDELKKVAGAIKTQEGWRAGTVRIERPQ